EGAVEARDAADQIAEVGEQLRGERSLSLEGVSAVWIAILAMFLAITSVAGGNAGDEEILNQEKSTNAYSYFQAKHIRATSFTLAADNLEAQLAAFGTQMAPETRQQLEQRVVAYRADAARLNGERQEILNWAISKEEARENQTKVGPSFDTAEALFQIAIVLASIAILLKRKTFLYPSLVVGVIALLFMVNGFVGAVPWLYDGPDKAPV
ncbi:MAG TPA: DUF4337 domain-containing protein, partial [Dehalococcoidia bacterium]|nr:DUF4337 domain-containing protein [Dehalococcoidia bacterium]